MNYLHYEVDAGPNNVVQVTLNRQANVRLLDHSNFQRYVSGQQHNYYGGFVSVAGLIRRSELWRDLKGRVPLPEGIQQAWAPRDRPREDK